MGPPTWEFRSDFWRSKTTQQLNMSLININLSPEAGTEAGSSQPQPPAPPLIVLSSRGPSGERQGGSLGVFDYVEQYNNSPAYRQRHTATLAGDPLYLYRAEPGKWRVGGQLGGSSTVLVNKTESNFVPSNNWVFYTGDSWQSDPEITVTTSLPVCGVITITLVGAAATAQPETEGKYRATGLWSAGRPVFSNGATYLRVRPGTARWEVTDQVKKFSQSKVLSTAASWCPASVRAGTWKYWDYWTYNGSGNATIWISCSYHHCNTNI